MPLTFDPSDVQDDGPARVVLPEGRYEAIITGCTEKTSSKGNQMYEIEVTIDDPESGRTVTVRDWLVATKAALWKTKEYCYSVGGLRIEQYENGDVPPDLEGDECCVLLGIESSSKYGDQNRVEKYLKFDEWAGDRPAPAEQSPGFASGTDGDDIPF